MHPTSTLLTSCKGSDGGGVLLIIFSILNPGVPHTIGFPRRCCLCHLIFVKFESVFDVENGTKRDASVFLGGSFWSPVVFFLFSFISKQLKGCYDDF